MPSWKDSVIDFLVRYGFQILGAVFILGAGVLLAAWIGRLTDAALKLKITHVPLRRLIVRIARLLVLALAAMLALDKFGVQITPLVAGVGVVGVGLSLAAQGVLGNLVSGLVIILTKPFTLEEYVEVVGVDGQVASIELFSTTLIRPDRSRVLIPNRKIVGEIVHNYGTIRQLTLSVGVAYATDLSEAIRVVRAVLQRNSRVLKDPEPLVGVSELADSSIVITARPWVNQVDIGRARTEIYEQIVSEFRQAGIQIPFPQREIRLLNQHAHENAG